MKRIFVHLMLALAVLGGTAAWAETVAAPQKTLSIIEFSQLPENRGLANRMLERKYQEYRHGVPRTTLDVSNIR